MKVIKYHRDDKAKIIAEALVILLSGGTVVYPTETAYAIGADFYSPGACRQVVTIKQRGRHKKLPVIVPGINYATTLVKFSPSALALAHKYWPGPLTLVLPFLYSKEWPHHGDDHLAVRVSSHPLAASLVHAFGRPLISTSSNISGAEPSYSGEEVIKHFRKTTRQPDLVIDAGTLPRVEPSTIIKEDAGRLEVLRQGPIKIDINA